MPKVEICRYCDKTFYPEKMDEKAYDLHYCVDCNKKAEVNSKEE